MRKLCSILSAPFFLLLILGVMMSARCQNAQAQSVLSDRITQPIDRSNVSTLAGSVHPLAQAQFEQGLTDNAKVLQGMTLNFKRTDAQEASLKALLQAQQNPASPSFRRWLTPAQFGQQFGMSAADIAKASAWLQQEGFTVSGVSQSNNSISFSGSVATVERVFQTQIHNYNVNGESHFANSTQISIPAALAGSVNSVRGLNDFRLKPKLQFAKKRAASNAHFTSGISGAHYVAPGDFATIYDVAPLYAGGATGIGETIGVVGQTDIVPADITDFRAAAGLSVNNPTVVTVPGSTPETVAEGAASEDLDETDLDLEWSGGVATGANIVLVNSGDVETSLEYVIQNTINGITIPIISQSYGDCESGYQTSDLTTLEGVLAQANAQGQTVLLAAGDSGAADCDGSTSTTIIQSATQGLAVDYPGSSVYVTDVGGTEYMDDGTDASPETGSGTYWNANGSNDVVSSAKSYIPEMVWNDTTYAITQNQGLSGGGGGVSSLWKKPSWQAGVPGIPADGFRDVPDVALTSSPYHDALLYCTQVQTVSSGTTYVSSCQSNSFRISDPGQSDDSDLTSAGGTSFAAPSFAGLLAIVEQELISEKVITTGGLGNINPSLYTLASNATTYASAFHDITTGNNQVPCTAGSPNCGTTGTNNVIGYTAGTGYDQASGLGSVDATNLAKAFTALVTSVGTQTTLTAAPSSAIKSGQTVTFTATVAPNTVTTAPTGTVTFTVDGVAQTPAAVSAAAPYVATLQTSFTTGTHTVIATYSSSDATYTGSTSSSVTINVTSSGAAATTTAVTANPTSFALGAALTLSATVTATTPGTLTGPITFTTGGVTIGTVKQVTIGTGDTATATLSVPAATASLGFAAGTDTITATYGGDTYNATSSGTTTVTVSNPSITLSATNITISSPSPGNSGTSTVTLTSVGGYVGTAVVSASASSLDADYQFGAAGDQTASIPLTAGGTGSTTIEITTIAAGSLQKGIKGNLKKNAARIAVAGGTAAGCILLLLVPGIRRKRWPAALIMLVFLSVGAGLGCGGGTGGGAPAGTYTVTLTAQDSSNASITGSTTFTVTVQ